MSYDMIDRFLRNNLNDDDYAEYSAALDELCTPPAQQEPVAGKGKELSERLKLCARNVAFVAAGRVDMSSAAMQEMFALIDQVCVGIDSPPAQQEPVAAQSVMTVRIWRDKNSDQNAEFKNWHKLPDGEHIFYTSPPAQRKPLTDEEIMDLCRSLPTTQYTIAFARAIEAKLKEKNNG